MKQEMQEEFQYAESYRNAVTMTVESEGYF